MGGKCSASELCLQTLVLSLLLGSGLDLSCGFPLAGALHTSSMCGSTEDSLPLLLLSTWTLPSHLLGSRFRTASSEKSPQDPDDRGHQSHGPLCCDRWKRTAFLSFHPRPAPTSFWGISHVTLGCTFLSLNECGDQSR